MSLRVLIAGGGIGGLCLAQGLIKAGIECDVFEKAPGIVQTGYRLHMNATGGAALRQCLPDNLFELYMQTSRINPRRELLVLIDHLGREIGTRPHLGPRNDPNRPHTAVNRRTLRQIMAVGLDDIVHYGRTVTGFDADADGVSLTFSDGSTATGDVLVAADGINSPIRQQLLPEVHVLDTGMRGMAGRAPLTDDLIATLPEALFDGFAAASGPDGIGFAYGAYQPRRPIAEAVANLAPGADIDPVDPYMMVNLGFAPDSPLLATIDDLRTATSDELYAAMRAAVHGWHPGLVELVERVDVSTVFSSWVRRLDPTAPWPSSRVTLLGDAIHAMPPSFGAGANTALRDAAALTAALTGVAARDVGVLDAIAAYEADMRASVFPILRASADPRAGDPDFRPEELYAGRG
ncbi:FAD-dependent monooxygenase [Mycolicibacterium sp. 018/SC-01/001]|uniref:FAD-dependent oxidoreductase n=1 Tax=Mycolicibacterium sp. 018/SC-01/001 TaxID=2592069 RepID=UPI00117F5E2C|nr:FAD-dependent monooxygenase [Mycolicibacterium sp. 018/SC-01/001]TRW87959.1 FAD-dependent monooxygenase [Mycolicibacterium sp. 018/SC-01/001]